MQNLLKGLRIVEGSAFIAAPSSGMALAQLGADVIRFDMIGGGIDYTRWPVDRNNQSFFWHGMNKGKRSIAVDFRKPEGQEILTQLITLDGENAGLFVTNFPAKGWLDYETLRQYRDDLIYLNLTGDRHGRSAVDYTVNCEVGFPYITGPDSEDKKQHPVNNALPAWDLITGQTIALGLLAAERHRRMTGEGQFIKLALADVAMATIGHLGFIGELTVNNQERPALGNDIFGAFGRDFSCSDGERIMIVGLSLAQWKSITRATGLQASFERVGVELGLDLTLEGDRFKAREPLSTLVANWFSGKTFPQVKKAFDDAWVCWGRYQSMGQMINTDPDCSEENPIFNKVEQPGMGSWLMPDNPLHFGAVAREPVYRAPELGEHTDEILAGDLGLSAVEIGKLHDKGIVAGK